MASYQKLTLLFWVQILSIIDYKLTQDAGPYISDTAKSLILFRKNWKISELKI